MLAQVVVVAIGCAILAGGALGDRFRLPSPVVLVAAGSLLAVVHALGSIGLPPEVVLFVFLPMLLYWECQSTSLREIRRYLRVVLLNGTLLVVVSAAAVAVVLHALGVAWGPACIIGAALAPTDATAVASLGGGLPRHNATVLQAESLVNDGMSLVLFSLAQSLTDTGQSITAAGVARLTGLSFGGGIAIGLVCGWLANRLRLRIHQSERLNLASVLTPFVAYLAAEAIGSSGVLAVVVCGLYMSQVTPRTVAAEARAQGTSFWTLATTVLNGALFVLVGLALPHTVGGLSTETLGRAAVQVVAAHLTLLLTRYLFVELSVVVIRALHRGPRQKNLGSTARYRVAHALAGFRGGVSLAMALSVPATMGGDTTPARDLIIFITATVVVMTLVVQGLLLPRAIRWAHLPPDESVEHETNLAQARATDAALDALPRLVDEMKVPPSLARLVRTELETQRETLAAPAEAGIRADVDKVHALRVALVDVKRDTVVDLRDAGTIDDVVLRAIQSRLDLEEIRYSEQATPDD